MSAYWLCCGFAAGIAKKDGSFLLLNHPRVTSNCAGHIELRGLQKHFRKVADDLGLPGDLKIYCGRHTFGTVVMEKTKNPYVVMEGMGHEDLDTTMGYMHNDTSQLKAVIDEWNRQKAEMATTPLTDSVQ